MIKLSRAILVALIVPVLAWAGLVTQSVRLGNFVASTSDTTPDQFTFTDQTNVALSTVITSAPVTITGINAVIPCSASNGTIDVNSSGSFAATQNTVNNNDTIRARQTSSASNSTAVNTLVSCGTGPVSDTFTSTTLSGASGVFFQPNIGALLNGNTLVSSGTFQDVNRDLGGDANVQSTVTRPGGQSKSIKIDYIQDESQATLVLYGTTYSTPGPFPATTSLFVRSYEMLDAGWATHWPQGLKTLRVFAGDHGNGCLDTPPGDIPYISEKILYPGYETSPDPRLETYVTTGSWAYCNRPELAATYTSGMIFGNGLPYIRTGVWYKWERWYVMNSAVDVADGIMQVWIDDVLVQNLNNVVYRSTSGLTSGAAGTTWKSMWFGGNYSNTGTFTATPPISRYIDSPYASTTKDR